MRKKNIFVRFVGYLARRFRVLQEVWILPWWGRGGLVSVPLLTLDIVILVTKLVSTCAVAIVRVFIPPTMKSLCGETVLITGAGQGIGRELALQFAELGATVIYWDNDARRNRAVVEEIRKKDGDLIEAFLPSMIEKRHGHIVAINSSSGLMPCSDMVPYCAAKFGLRGLMESLSEELRLDTWTKNINTTSVYLATVSTGLYPPPSHRFTWWYSEISAKEAARIIIEGIRKNRKCISIPCFMKTFIAIHNLMPYRIRIILTDFFNYPHRGWFCFC
ncbi:retinol dehydrogenase 10-like isoform X2 [Colias croceus]|uniref:retinol dehydrogenase 10-like isoform X2 n=1 Tax=Colias crocea TaxID=72248 RepID=UPI001E280955|nr:retinol dehydrogenase 10-like isoform X2 [Colias croceus]